MEINLTILFKTVLLYSVNFLVVFYIYRYSLYPKLRWHQKDNICHDNRMGFSICVSSLLFITEFLIYNKTITFTF